MKARGLGIFSAVLGVGELLAPRTLTRWLGVRPSVAKTSLVRGLGARELAVGIALLRARRRSPWLWARVAGDVVDLALLAAALRGKRPGRVWGTFALTAGVTSLDILAARRASENEKADAREALHGAVTIARARTDVYRFWRDPTNLASFMSDIESVQAIDDTRSRWHARGPAGPAVTWEAVIEEDQPGIRLRWRSLEGSEVDTDGEVTFEDAPGDRGTEVRLTMRYAPHDGIASRAGRFLWRTAAELRIEADLRRLKQVLETGHVVHSDASVHRGPHPAAPSETTGTTREVRQ